MTDQPSAMTVKCPDCLKDLSLEQGVIGDYFECETCFCELIISSLVPPAVEIVEDEK